MSSLQKSIWSSDEPSALHHRQSLTSVSKKNINNNQLTINVWSDETSKIGEDDPKKINSVYWFCIQCFIVGSLLAGIALAIVLTFWLTNTKTTSQVSSITTSSESTTSTTTDTTTTTSVILATSAPPCSLAVTVSSIILLTITSATNILYNCYAFSWVSSVTGTVSLTFQFRHDTSYWNLDDVSVYNGASQILGNGGFETGSLLPWVRTPPPSGNCVGATGGQVVVIAPHTGRFNLQDHCKMNTDKISQQFAAIAGQIYIVSFWLQSESLTSSGTLANVTLS